MSANQLTTNLRQCQTPGISCNSGGTSGIDDDECAREDEFEQRSVRLVNVKVNVKAKVKVEVKEEEKAEE
jgi:hypothetical protein